MHPMVLRRVENHLEGAQRPHALGMNPKLIKQIKLLVRDEMRRRDGNG